MTIIKYDISKFDQSKSKICHAAHAHSYPSTNVSRLHSFSLINLSDQRYQPINESTTYQVSIFGSEGVPICFSPSSPLIESLGDSVRVCHTSTCY